MRPIDNRCDPLAPIQKLNHIKVSKLTAFCAGISAVIGIVSMLFGSLSCSPKGYSGPVESISIGFQPNEGAAEIYVAKDKQFFTNNGLEVTIKDYENGIAAVNGMLAGELNLAGAAETPFVTKAFEHQAISIIACANKLEFVFLVGRIDKGIENISDLSGKKIGVAPQTISGFYLSRFLGLHGMSTNLVTIMDMPPSQSVEALMTGTVDAIVVPQPNAEALKSQPGANVVTWMIQSDQPIFGLLIGKNDWINQNPELIKRFLKSVDQANEYIIEHLAEVKSILKSRFGYTDEYLATALPQHNFSLSLDKSLIVAMEDEARWMIANNLTTEKTVPDFMNYIYSDGLKAVKPEAVNIVK